VAAAIFRHWNSELDAERSFAGPSLAEMMPPKSHRKVNARGSVRRQAMTASGMVNQVLIPDGR
jgi:hypothetical protein